MFGLLGLINQAGKEEMKKFGTVVGGVLQGKVLGGYLTSRNGKYDTDKLYIFLDNELQEFPFKNVKGYSIVQPSKGLQCAIYEIEWMSGKRSLIEFSRPGESNFVKGYNIYRINNY